MRPSWSPASAGCSFWGVSAWIHKGNWRGCLLFPCSQWRMTAPSVPIWCPGLVTRRLPSGEWSSWISGSFCFSPLPFLSHALLYRIPENRGAHPPPTGDEQIHATRFPRVLTCCINIANDTPNKKGKHYPYCKNVTSARGFLKGHFPWLSDSNYLNVPAPSPWQAQFKGGVSNCSKAKLLTMNYTFWDHRMEASFAWAPRELWSFATVTHVPTTRHFAPSSAPSSTASGSEDGSTSGSRAPTWKVNLKSCFLAAASASSPFKELQSL